MGTLPKMRLPERWSAVAFLGAGALAGIAAFEPLGTASDGPDHRLAERPNAADDGTSGAFLAAPPFDPARRRLTGSERLPVPPPPLEIAEEMPKEEPPVLSGIIADGPARKALFVGAGNWLGIGETVHGWTVASVEPRRVVGEAVGDVPWKPMEPFVGAPAAMRFLAPADPLLEAGGINRVSLGLEWGPNGRPDLMERRAPARGEDAAPGLPTVLIEGVSGLSIRYAGPVAGGQPAWQAEWRKGGLPALISLEIATAPGDGRHLPPVLVHPATSASRGMPRVLSAEGDDRPE